MNRRQILAAGWTLPFAVRRFQDDSSTPSATPEAEERKYIQDFIDPSLQRPELAVGRFFDSPDLSLYQRWDGHLYFLTAFACIFDDESAVIPFARELAQAVCDQWVYGTQIELGNLARTSMRALGDTSEAWTVELQNDDDDWVVGFVIVQQANTLQFLYGSADAGSPVIVLADVSEKSVTRWPDDSPSQEGDDGIMRGDIWAALPTLSDLPEGMTFIGERGINF